MLIRIVSCVGLLLCLLRPDALVAQTKPVSLSPKAQTTKSDSPPSQATQQTREIDELQKKVKSLSADLQLLETFVYQTLLERLGDLEQAMSGNIISANP